jgi:hypothetical protein
MRFLADENVSRLVVERLRAAGLMLHRSRKRGRERQTRMSWTRRIAVTASWSPRIAIGELVIRQRLKVRGVILLELDRLPSAMEAELVAETVRIHAKKLTGNLLVVEPARVRIRPLPR